MKEFRCKFCKKLLAKKDVTHVERRGYESDKLFIKCPKCKKVNKFDFD